MSFREDQQMWLIETAYDHLMFLIEHHTLSERNYELISGALDHLGVASLNREEDLGWAPWIDNSCDDEVWYDE